MSAEQTCPDSCFYRLPVRRRACGLRVSRAKFAPSRGGGREVLSTHQLHSWGNNLPAHPALYLESSLGMQTYISGLSATQTKKGGGGQEKLVWFQCWTQTANIKRGLSHWCISVSNITPSSKAFSPGYGSEQCFFLLILMRKMCPLLLGNIVESRRKWSKLLWRGLNVFEIFKVISSMLGLLTCPNMWEPLRNGGSQS